MVAVSGQRLIQGEGTLESVWQPWLQSGGVTTLSIDEFLPRSFRLVVVAPHPDDEVLACGGLMAMHRAQDGDVCVVAVSDGEASHAGSSRWNAQNLAATRRAESVEGLNHLGFKDVPVIRLDLPDGLVAQHILHLSLRLQMLLRPADVVVTTWRNDGHPDHDATGFAASLACSAVGCRLVEAPVWMWHWAIPEHALVPWQRLQRLKLTPLARDRKRAALSAHVSQLDECCHAGGPVLGASIVQRAGRPEEYFFTTEERLHEAHG